MLADFLARLVRPDAILSQEDWDGAMEVVLGGHASPAQLGAFLMGLRIRGPVAEDIAAVTSALHARAQPFHRPILPKAPYMDTCGTGGDGAGLFNVSTAAALLLAAGGVPVAKHGNRGATSKCGSADVLEALGYRIDSGAEVAARVLEETSFCYLHAPSFHPGLKFLASARRELGFRTIFNSCGPLANPARPEIQLVGVGAEALLEPTGRALARLGRQAALVVHGHGGIDEIATSGPTRGLLLTPDGFLKEWHLDPAAMGIPMATHADLAGGDASSCARTLKSVLQGHAGACADMANLNAGVGFWLCGRTSEMKSGYALAVSIQRSGRAWDLLERAAELSRATLREE